MSNEQYYIRVRGRVQGPFETDQLHSMAKRGQFSRLHEVSNDGNTWRPASESPNLFPVCTVAVTVMTSTAAPENTAYSLAPETAPANPSPSNDPPANASAAADWYYNHAGTQGGPHDLETLRMLVKSGQVQADDLAWTSGMVSWLPVNQISALNAASATSVPPLWSAPRPSHSTAAEEPSTAGMAIAAVVLGMLAAALASGSVALSLFVSPAVSIGAWLTAVFVSVLTVIFGHAARKQIRRAPTRFNGGGLAMTGLVMAYLVLTVAGFIALFLLAIVFITAVGLRASLPS